MPVSSPRGAVAAMDLSLPLDPSFATPPGPMACGVQVRRNRRSSASEHALECHRNQRSSAVGITVQVAPEYAPWPMLASMLTTG
jgi:hypothetical protein